VHCEQAQAVSAGKAKAIRAAVPAKPATAEASASEYSAYSAFHRNAVRPAAKVVAAIDVAGAQAPAKTSTSQTARTEDEIPLVSGAEDQLFVSREVAIMPMELGLTDGPDGTAPPACSRSILLYYLALPLSLFAVCTRSAAVHTEGSAR
jgi:hypothetical protein